MRLENLYPNFGKASPDSQAQYIASYRLRRAKDMILPPLWPKQKKQSKAKAPSLTAEEKALMKLLKLKKKDIIEIRSLKNETNF